MAAAELPMIANMVSDAICIQADMSVGFVTAAQGGLT